MQLMMIHPLLAAECLLVAKGLAMLVAKMLPQALPVAMALVVVEQ